MLSGWRAAVCAAGVVITFPLGLVLTRALGSHSTSAVNDGRSPAVARSSLTGAGEPRVGLPALRQTFPVARGDVDIIVGYHVLLPSATSRLSVSELTVAVPEAANTPDWVTFRVQGAAEAEVVEHPRPERWTPLGTELTVGTFHGWGYNSSGSELQSLLTLRGSTLIELVFTHELLIQRAVTVAQSLA